MRRGHTTTRRHRQVVPPSAVGFDERPGRGFPGVAIGDATKVISAYQQGSFWYQFRDQNHRSRVCLCDNEGELLWLAGQVALGARIVIRHSTRPKMA